MKGKLYPLFVSWIILFLVVSACAARQASAPAAETPAVARLPLATDTRAASQFAGEKRLYEAAKKEGEVVVWANFWQYGLVEKRFMEKYPGIKATVWNAQTGTTVVVRIIEESKAGKTSPDFVVLAPTDMPPLMEAGLLKEYAWTDKGVPNQPSHRLYLSHTYNPYAPVYNSDLVTASEAPKSWDGLQSERWRRKSYMSSSGEGIPLMFAYLWRTDGNLAWDKASKFWKDVRASAQPTIVSGFVRPLELLAAGEYDIFLLTPVSAFLRLKWRGAPLEMVPVGKVSSQRQSAAIMKSAPHPAAAQLWADFFASPEGLAAYADVHALVADSPEAARLSRVTREYGKVGIELEAIPDGSATEKNLQEATRLWRDITSQR